MRAPRSITYSAVLIGYVLSFVAVDAGLPTDIPPSWSASNGEVVWLGGFMVALLLPTAVAVTETLLRGLCLRHPIDESDTAGALPMLDAIVARVAVFVVSVHAAVLAGVLGLLSGEAWASRVVPLMLGVTLIGVGNLVPRIRPNRAIGIRTERTLSDRACWLRTHRRVGYLVVAGGVVVVLSALAVPEPVGPGMILLVGPAALIGTWLLLRSQMRRTHA